MRGQTFLSSATVASSTQENLAAKCSPSLGKESDGSNRKVSRKFARGGMIENYSFLNFIIIFKI